MAAPIPLPVLTTRPTRHPGADTPKHKCGVFAVWGHPDPVHLAYLGLYAQQHRGQESAGIAVTDGHALHAHLGMGLVPEIFAGTELASLKARAPRGAIAHNRYSTAGGSLACNVQPLVETYVAGQIGVAHNGNLINADAHRARFSAAGHLFHTTSDTEVIIHLLASPEQQRTRDPVAATLRRLQGAYSLCMLFPDRIECARDPWGWRPLVLGEMPDTAPVVASETVALDVVGARFVREIEPGEILTISDAGVSSRRFAPRSHRLAKCVFEHVYFASPASTIFGQNVQLVREALGAQLAKEAPVDADYVMPMPDSGRSAANGYARVSNIPYREGIVPNRYVGRTFIKPTQDQRRAAVRLKLNVIGSIVAGKRIIVVDDSIVRGTTTREKMQQLREAGAKEIHLRISCPPIQHPCHFGVDFASREQLIASGKSVEEIRRYLGVDSLHYLSLEGLLACVNGPSDDWCTACYSGDYRLDPAEPTTSDVFEDQLEIFEPAT
ncbi:MAG: amidophosphoribosyltransferase [Phycisphaerales bacterium]|jgi:amidophosphoribosyltransferase|nr:amidophosphoribosyltransferase [Phycisphaerales bacterium]